METNNTNFDFDKFQREHEGLFPKISRWCRSHIKIVAIVTVLAGISSIITGIVQLNSKDPSEVLESLYLESKDDIDETEQLIKLVELPDSIENLQEVQQLRAFQNKVLGYSILYQSIVKNSNIKSYNIDNKEELEEFVNSVHFRIHSLMCLINYSREIIIDVSALIEKEAPKDTIFLKSLNYNVLIELIDNQEVFNKMLKEKNKEVEKSMASKNYKNTQDITNDLLTSDKLLHYSRLTKKLNTMFMNSVNLRLINIKNKEIEKTFGQLKRNKNINKIFFTPSYIMQGKQSDTRGKIP